jgi:hypothetical protein
VTSARRAPPRGAGLSGLGGRAARTVRASGNTGRKTKLGATRREEPRMCDGGTACCSDGRGGGARVVPLKGGAGSRRATRRAGAARRLWPAAGLRLPLRCAPNEPWAAAGPGRGVPGGGAGGAGRRRRPACRGGPPPPARDAVASRGVSRRGVDTRQKGAKLSSKAARRDAGPTGACASAGVESPGNSGAGAPRLGLRCPRAPPPAASPASRRRDELRGRGAQQRRRHAQGPALCGGAAAKRWGRRPRRPGRAGGRAGGRRRLMPLWVAAGRISFLH